MRVIEIWYGVIRFYFKIYRLCYHQLLLPFHPVDWADSSVVSIFCIYINCTMYVRDALGLHLGAHVDASLSADTGSTWWHLIIWLISASILSMSGNIASSWIMSKSNFVSYKTLIFKDIEYKNSKEFQIGAKKILTLVYL